jgi:hypothetical protein
MLAAQRRKNAAQPALSLSKGRQSRKLEGEEQAPKGRKNSFQTRRLLPLGVQIPPPSIPESQSHPDQHKSHRRYQQHQHRPVQRLLSILRSGSGASVAHRATLPQRGQSKKTKDSGDEHYAKRPGNRTHDPYKTVSFGCLSGSS